MKNKLPLEKRNLVIRIYSIVITLCLLVVMFSDKIGVKNSNNQNSNITQAQTEEKTDDEENEIVDVHYPDANTRDTYDTIHNVREAQQLATGKDIKVGILDWCFGFHDGVLIYEDGVDLMTFKGHQENFEHERGHGYWMATTLKEIAPDVKVYAIGTFDTDDETKWVDSLIKGIDWS